MLEILLYLIIIAVIIFVVQNILNFVIRIGVYLIVGYVAIRLIVWISKWKIWSNLFSRKSETVKKEKTEISNDNVQNSFDVVQRPKMYTAELEHNKEIKQHKKRSNTQKKEIDVKKKYEDIEENSHIEKKPETTVKVAKKKMTPYELEQFAIECNAYVVREERKEK